MIDEHSFCRTGFARFSDDRSMRYILRRTTTGRSLDEERGHPEAVFVMLNPSTADAFKADPTIRRCIDFAQRWRFRRMTVVNLFARRATDPRDLIAASDRGDGQIADEQILHECCDEEALVVCAWGVHGTLTDRDQTVISLLERAGVKMHALGLTKGGHPRHPLYLPASSEPRRWKP